AMAGERVVDPALATASARCWRPLRVGRASPRSPRRSISPKAPCATTSPRPSRSSAHGTAATPRASPNSAAGCNLVRAGPAPRVPAWPATALLHWPPTARRSGGLPPWIKRRQGHAAFGGSARYLLLGGGESLGAKLRRERAPAGDGRCSVR